MSDWQDCSDAYQSLARDALQAHAQACKTPEQDDLRVSILDRRSTQCAWVDGTAADGLALCCGARVLRPGVSWCELHARRVIRKAAWKFFAREVD